MVVIAIGYLSLFPYEELGFLWETSDVIKHFFAYLILSILLQFPVRKITPGYSTLSRAFLIIAICFVYGVLLELGQYLSPGRHPSVYDALMNFLGALVGQVAIIIFTKSSGTSQHRA